MKQIVDKLNKIAKKIDESVEIPQTDLIIDSLDAITKAYGGTPNDSNLIVDKLEDIAGVAHSGITPTGNIAITENTAEGEPLNIAQYATATVNVVGGGDNPLEQCQKCVLTLTNADSQDIASNLLIDILANLTLVQITVTNGRLDSDNSFIDNHIPSFNIAPGNSMTFDLYYTMNNMPGAPIGLAFNTNQFTFSFSNINNMELLTEHEVSGYFVTNTDNDSAITVTATVTVQ